ncbi:MAG: alcohol dehydrogenase catalytic domain-containing protein [Rhodobacteraceae bacterium]|nr:alcohol dehydrogenase catalytic domain-containing protein [Paracoccaceae bacterium]MCY4197891.1 alcohol dehydrogenase catalytic domain-containing protein [Paracoccaceae bacterium]
MKALVYNGPCSLDIQEADQPQPAEGEVRVRVDSVGICGSDMHAYLGHDERRSAPLILGHEAAGTIAEGPEAGKRVTINPLVSCGQCPNCKRGCENICPHRQIISMAPRQGAFAEYVVIPRDNLVEVPAAVTLSVAALAEPLAVSWHAARLGLAALHPDIAYRTLIIGGGTIGLAAALVLKAMGVEDIVLTEPNERRRAYLAARGGVTADSETSGQFSLIFDAVGYAVTRATASQHVAPGGVIVHIGLGEDSGGLDVRRMTLQEITFIGTYTYTLQDFRDTAAAIFDGRLGELDWTDIRPLDAGAEAFADIRAGRVAAPKVILKP